MKRLLQKEIASIHAAALILGAAGLLSRVLGLVRNRLLFARFGAGRELDVYYAAFQIPDFLATLFLLGAASAAILPLFQQYRERDPRNARAFIAGVSGIFLVCALPALAAAFFLMPALAPLVAPGFSPADRETVVLLSRLMLVSPVLFGLSGIFSVVVQSYRLFFIYALAPVLYNVGIIGGIILLSPAFGIRGVAAGVAAGAVLHAGVQIAAAWRLGFRPGLPRPSLPGIKKVLLLSFPRVLALSLTQLTAVSLVAMGSLLSHGSVAIFSAAQDLYFLPIGVLAASYAVALFPRLAAAAARNAGDDFFADLYAGIRSILFWTAPVAALTLVLRAHVVRVALGAGAFSWEDTRLTAAVLAILAAAMAAGALQTLLIRAFYAIGNTWLPLGITIVSSLLSLGVAAAGVRQLAGDGSAVLATLLRVGDIPHPEVLGLGLGFAAGLVVQIAMLMVLIRRRAGQYFGMRPGGDAREIIAIIGAALCAGVAAYLVRAGFSEVAPLITFARVAFQGAVAAAAGFGVYWGVLAFAGSTDVIALRRAAARHLFSLGVLPKEWGESTDI